MIKSIDFKLAGNKDKRIQIELNGKNLIITGGNGCGKTRFINQLNAYLGQFLLRNIKTDTQLELEIQQNSDALSHYKKSDKHYANTLTHITNLKDRLTKNTNESMNISGVDNMFDKLHKKTFLLRNFTVDRLSNQIASDGQIKSIEDIKLQGVNDKYQQDSSNKFEAYLVSYYNYSNHVIARENDPEKVQNIDKWFDKVQNDLRELFEDPQLKLTYKPKKQIFHIEQQGKDAFRLNELSSGYSSILSIYADLLMKVELRDIASEELSGFVLIDEIDAHLHVSLQRKIFSFFNNAFPNIQFIVTTHSPFVVQSVHDSVIYDLSKNEALEDLSMYSYESILKGLLGVESTSDTLNNYLDEIAELISQKPLNIERTSELVELIEPFESKLDSRSRTFLLIGKNSLSDAADGTE